MGSSANNVAIEGVFATGWGATTPVKYDNGSLLDTDGITPITTTNGASWVSVEVWDGSTFQAALGGANCVVPRRSVGTVFVTIFTPLKGGSKDARVYADQVKAIFRDVQVSGITFEEPDAIRLGEVYYAATGGVASGTAQWYQMKVAIPFEADEFI